MGSDGHPFADSDENPVHTVTLKAFQLAKTEVTNKQYRACVEAGVCSAPGSYDGGDDHPVVKVNWDQARIFSEWVGGRLPSEAEWEYAARSPGKDFNYPWGNEDATCDRAVMNDGVSNGCGRAGARPVCSKELGNTVQGLCDMIGNVREWTQDWYYASYQGAPADGSARENPAGSDRVIRGGGWNAGSGVSRAANRDNRAPDYVSISLGFRPAR